MTTHPSTYAKAKASRLKRLKLIETLIKKNKGGMAMGELSQATEIPGITIRHYRRLGYLKSLKERPHPQGYWRRIVTGVEWDIAHKDPYRHPEKKSLKKKGTHNGPIN